MIPACLDHENASERQKQLIASPASIPRAYQQEKRRDDEPPKNLNNFFHVLAALYHTPLPL